MGPDRNPGDAPRPAGSTAREVAVVLWAVRDPWLIRSASATAETLGPAGRDLAAGRCLADALAPEDRAPLGAALRALVASERDAMHFEFRLRDPGGPPLRVRAVIAPDRTSSGFVSCFRGYLMPENAAAAPAAPAEAHAAAGSATDRGVAETSGLAMAEGGTAAASRGARASAAGSAATAVTDTHPAAPACAHAPLPPPAPASPVAGRPFRLRDVVDHAMRALAPLASRRGLEILSEVDASVPDLLIGDAVRLREAILALAGSGVRATESGGVTVIASLARGDGEMQLMLAIEDTAPCAEPTLDGSGGSGLRDAAPLVAAMGGHIEVEASPGRGTTYFVWVPVRIPDARGAPNAAPPAAKDARVPAAPPPAVPAAPKPVARPRGAQLRILLADDNAIHRSLAHRLLDKRGYVIVAVDSGRAAVEAAAAGTFDVILMDVHMPEMDGLEATHAIRKAEGPTRHTPIIGLTTLAIGGDREACLAAGMDDYVAKPIDPAALYACIERILAPVP